MAVLEYNGIGPGSYIVSKANGYRSLETITLKEGENLIAGTLLGKVTDTGEFKRYDPDATDGSEHVAGILHETVDATEEAKKCVAMARDGEVNGKLLTYSDGADDDAIATANTELEALGLIVR